MAALERCEYRKQGPHSGSSLRKREFDVSIVLEHIWDIVHIYIYTAHVMNSLDGIT